MKINKIVQDAINQNKPVVVLESTIISHGMPYPQNVKTALLVEEEIIKNGAIPATIGIIDGEIVVGMTHDEIEEFGKRKGIKKVSRRDLPIVVAKKQWGATTVAATMIIAQMAGIEVFVTGGIGGVHRGAQETFDISADLDELGKTNVTVICAGAKAILDLPLTLEYLETKGVPLLSMNSEYLADFYTSKSDLKVENVVSSPEELAGIIKAKRALKLDGGILVSNPIPEEYSMNKEIIDSAIENALLDAKNDNIMGKDVTPYLLKRIVEITGGQSLEANIKLILNNAKLGALTAVALSK